MTTWCVRQLSAVTQRATKVARSSTKVLLNEAIKRGFSGFFIVVGLGFFLRQKDNLGVVFY